MENTSIIGTTDAVTSCDCCGRSGLKLTVIVRTGDGEVKHFGSVCATGHTGRTSAQIRSEAQAAIDARRLLATAELRAAPEYQAVEQKHKEARDLNKIGKAFRLHCLDVQNALQALQVEIAAKHGFKPFELYC